MFYTGVGARSTPSEILEMMTAIATVLAPKYTLRSGGAKGADAAFEAGAGLNKHIYYANDATPEAMEIASRYHPAWNRCSNYVKKLHGRNAFQVLGNNLKTPSEFVICWTPDGCKKHKQRTINTGGTGTAISIASEHNVHVWNLCYPSDFVLWNHWLKQQKGG